MTKRTTHAIKSTKRINIALQGGGAHGAFTWGVMDKLIEDGRIAIEGLSATSAGSMNACVYAYGKMTGGLDGARECLHNFWYRVSEAGRRYSPVQRPPWLNLWHNAWDADHLPSYWWFESMTRALSPYQLNPFNFNPLRQLLSQSVDFEELNACRCTSLFISATDVKTGKVRVFRNQEITLDVAMASACLPYLFQAVKIGDAHYWDGGFMGNPALHPFFRHTESRDIVIVHINPIVREAVPTTAADITDRINEITFNSSLLRDLRAIAFVVKLLEEGWLKEEYRSRLKHVLVHSIHADGGLSDLGVSSKLNCDWAFLTHLRDLGRDTAANWLEDNYRHVGTRASIDIRKELTDSGVHNVG